jgi:type IV pilus assembly protein PilV
MNSRVRHGQAGFLLLEVVAALLLFSLGLLGMVQLQARASQLSVDAEDRSRAALLANEMVASMWGQRNLTVDDATLQAWQKKAADPKAGGLPDGRAQVTLVTPRLAVISIGWKADLRLADQADGRVHRYVTQVVMP